MKEKVVMITSPTNNTTVVAHKFLITREMIDFFVKFTSIPIPSTNPEYIDYYLQVLSKYYDTNMWNIFVDEIKNYGINRIRHECGKVRALVLEEIKSNPEYVQFCKTTINIPIGLTTGNNVYQSNFASKWFVSIDVKAANFTFLKHNCPSINTTWTEFIGKYTNSQFVVQSKPNR